MITSNTSIVTVTNNSVAPQLLPTIHTDSAPVHLDARAPTESPAITQSAVPKITLETVRNQLKPKGLNNLNDNERSALHQIKNHIYSQNFCHLPYTIEQDKCPILTSQILEIHNIVSCDYKAAYKPLIKILLKQELEKFTEQELEDGAVIMHTLTKINTICNANCDTLVDALHAIILEHKITVRESPYVDTNIEKKSQVIVTHLNNNPNSLNLMTSLYVNEELALKDPFASINVDDDSSEERGFFASIKYNVVYAFFHSIEFVQEKIWGKKVHRSFGDGIDEKYTGDGGNECHDHSTSYFKDAIKIFAWIPYFGSFFSTRNETKENKHEVALILQDTEESTKAYKLGIKITNQLKSGDLYSPLDIPLNLTQKRLELMSSDMIQKIHEQLTTLTKNDPNHDLINLINLCSTVLDNKEESSYSDDECGCDCFECHLSGTPSNPGTDNTEPNEAEVATML